MIDTLEDHSKRLEKMLKIGVFVEILEFLYQKGTGKPIQVRWNDENNKIEGETFEFIKDIISLDVDDLNEYTTEDIEEHYKLEFLTAMVERKLDDEAHN